MDNLLKGVFQGPSWCTLCNQHPESIGHLLDLCHFAGEIWDTATKVCNRSHRVHDNVVSTIEQWPSSPFRNNLLNYLRDHIPGSLVWNLWKERNRHIFEDKKRTCYQIWQNIRLHIQEVLCKKHWDPNDLPTLPEERRILFRWDLNL